MKNVQLELYTRPTCSDCQEGKAFLAKHRVSFINHDLSEHPEKEKDLRKLTGTRMVPAFVFKEKSLRGRLKKPKTLIGFENNVDEIKQILNID
ncbi:glutaredoxin family protein [Pseudogracilibacillus auburnensis]|uniref:Glutaredoxin 3 n=1 Tax=Pseudogracilibacillus auburnensis TaxID=1494959 RepID=A0A2V3VSK9_9BACI|nr:glutaredoxin family protein [Pseudogracilibacillus auburnensis]MBO1001305.1 glutaredoxin family protein [Pseudogracilibacillus auburnensis]PXW83831.1 glutaredoxin 3 [Pseudogracilibacillus auburnensis]